MTTLKSTLSFQLSLVIIETFYYNIFIDKVCLFALLENISFSRLNSDMNLVSNKKYDLYTIFQYTLFFVLHIKKIL